MVRRPVLLIVLLGIASILPAQQSWEGLATVSSFGRFPAGLYGASNLVYPNSLVSVRNLETGMSERIIITAGVDDPGMFLVLSPEAAVLLNVSGSGVTRVRLTTIVSDTAPADTASEQLFHPDPDINPSAGVGLDTELAALNIAVEDGLAGDPIEEIVAAVAQTEEPTEESVEVVEEPIEVVEEPMEVVEEPIKVVEEPIEVVEEPEVTPVSRPTTTGQRSGIVAGVARTRVGRAQESFERPETALEVERPGPIAETLPRVGEPEVEPEEVATIGMVTLDRAEQPIPAVSVQPDLPLVEDTTDAEQAVEPRVEDRAVEDAAAEVTPVEAPEPNNPIRDAVAAAVNRLPARDFFPPPVGEESDLGFAGLNRPTDAESIRAALAEAVVPPVDRPELAGLAPLQAAPEILPSWLAEVALPPEDVPEFAAFGPQTPRTESIGDRSLPVARAGAEERPVVQDLPPRAVPGATLTAGTLAEATVAPPETPSQDAVEMVSPPAEPVDDVLAQAGVAESERPELADVRPAEAPTEADLEAILAEAVVGGEERPELADVGPAHAPAGVEIEAALAEAAVTAEERPDLADVGPAETPTEAELEAILVEAAVAAEERPVLTDVGPAEAPTEAELEATLAEAAVEGEERPELADVGPAEIPGVPPFEASLVEAAVTPPESPRSDAVERFGSPVESVDAELAEAAVTESVRPELADVGPAEVPPVDEVAVALAEATPEAEERPDDSLAAAEPRPDGEVSGVTLEPEPGEEEISVAEGSIEAPGDIPDDALLTLEPADFRPPEYPSPDEESLIDREVPAEEPEIVVVLEIPVSTQPTEEIEPAEVVEPVEAVEAVVAEPESVDVAVATTARLDAVPGELPVVSDLVDNYYYLQIGAYTVPATAQVAVDALSPTYPMAVLPIDSHGTTVYRVLVGPLDQDETGTLLLWLRAKGYRDTFIRSGTEL